MSIIFLTLLFLASCVVGVCLYAAAVYIYRKGQQHEEDL